MKEILLVLGVLLVIQVCLIQVGALCPFYSRRGEATALVVRPVDLPKLSFTGITRPRTVLQEVPPLLKPIKPVNADLCSCKATVVSPAIPAKPPNLFGGGYRTDFTNKLLQKLTASASSSISAFGSNVLPSFALPPPAPACDPVPVPSDPVSMQLALEAQKKLINVAEDQLNFGFRSIPKEMPIEQEVKKSMIEEENLFSLNGAVVALKPPTLVTATKTIDEEAEETLLMEQVKAAATMKMIGTIKKPTLGQLGFGPALIQSAPTITLEGSALSEASASSSASASVNIPGAPSYVCNDGSIPGQVFQGSVPKVEKYIFPSPPLPPCDDAEDAIFLPQPPQPIQTLVEEMAMPSFKMSSCSSSAASSAASSSYSISSAFA